ncbi:hypothetical protein ACI2KR_06510 [Pseudomonas luteola]
MESIYLTNSAECLQKKSLHNVLNEMLYLADDIASPFWADQHKTLIKLVFEALLNKEHCCSSVNESLLINAFSFEQIMAWAEDEMLSESTREGLKQYLNSLPITNRANFHKFRSIILVIYLGMFNKGPNRNKNLLSLFGLL